MHPDLNTFSITLPTNDKEKMEEFNKMMDEMQNAQIEYIQIEAEKLDINVSDMSLIFYLRTRSRWTQEKEDYLIQLSKAGKRLPNVLAGEF